MNQEIVLQKLKEAEKDQDFIKMLFEQDTPEKIRAAFATKGIELSLGEVKSLVVNVVDSIENKNVELDETALDEVAGGFVISTTLIGLAVVGAMAIGGTVIGWKLAKGKC